MRPVKRSCLRLMAEVMNRVFVTSDVRLSRRAWMDLLYVRVLYGGGGVQLRERRGGRGEALERERREKMKRS